MTATRRRKGAAEATEAEGSSHVSGTTDATSVEATTTKRPEMTTPTQTRRQKGAAAAPTKTDDREGENGDVPGYVPTPEDLCLREVYGDWVHGNPGTHLPAGSIVSVWWHDRKFTPPPLPQPVLRNTTVQVRAWFPMNPVPIDLPET